MRSFLAALTGVTALILLAGAVPMIWVDRNLAQQEGFVSMASEFAEDADFQVALSSAIGREVVDQLQLPAGLAVLAQPAISQAANSILQDPGYPRAWAETLRRSHDLTVVDPSANANDSRVLNLDIGPLLQLVADRAGQVVGQDFQLQQQVLLQIGGAEQRNAMVWIATVAPGGWLLGFLAILLFLLCLLVTKRRSKALMWCAVGLASVAGSWKLGLDVLSRTVLSARGDNQLADLFKQEYVTIASASMHQWILVSFLIAVALFLAGGLGWVVSRGRGSGGRDLEAPSVRPLRVSGSAAR